MPNANVESFTGRFRDECLNESWLTGLANAQAIEDWRREVSSLSAWSHSPETTSLLKRPTDVSPVESKDLEVRTLGPCSICGQEQLLRTRAFIGSEDGVTLDIRQFTDCGCGPRPYTPPDSALQR